MVGQVHISRRINNIFVTLTNDKGKVITASSSGFVGYMRSKKVSPQAAEASAKRIAARAFAKDIYRIDLILRMRVNIFVFAVIRGLRSYGLRVRTIFAKVPMPHNGIKAKHKRRY